MDDFRGGELWWLTSKSEVVYLKPPCVCQPGVVLNNLFVFFNIFLVYFILPVGFILKFRHLNITECKSVHSKRRSGSRFTHGLADIRNGLDTKTVLSL